MPCGTKIYAIFGTVAERVFRKKNPERCVASFVNVSVL